jgi:hypothetical protein
MLRSRPSSPDPCLLLARVSGIPGTTMNQFSSDFCEEWLPMESSLNEELAAIRAGLAERLHDLVRLASPELRRFLLAVRRDAFNGRTLTRHRADSRWCELARLADPLAEQALCLEDRLASWRAEYASAYHRWRAREHRMLLSVLEDRGFRRGLALASPVLAEAAERARLADPAVLGRRKSRLDLGLLRYASRAALKLSPFSTLTRVALGRVDGEAPEPLAWTESEWNERPLLRMSRFQAEELLELFHRYRPFREGLLVARNPTLEEISPERYRFFRPERRVPDVQGGKLRHESASLVEMSLPLTLVADVFREVGEGSRVYRRLTAALAAEPGGTEAARLALDALIEAGVLLLESPWPSNEPHLEKRLLAHLRTLDESPELTAVIHALDLLVALEEGFSEAVEPARSLVEIDHTLNNLWRATASLANLDPGIGRFRGQSGDVCEDVLLVSARTGQEILRVSRKSIREIVRSAEPWARLVAFQGHRFDFLHTLAAFLSQRWPGRGEVGFLDLFGAAQPLWREYRKLTSSGAGSWRSPFNPMGLEVVETLASLRVEVWTRLQEILRSLPAGAPLSLEVLEDLAARIPESYAPPLGPCLFVQPTDATADLWVLNRVFEGTGRYGSRFTAAMDEDTRHRYTGHYIRAAIRPVAGEPADLVDLMWSRRDTLNVHAVQTARVLAIPGETLDRRTAEPVELRDLRVSQNGVTGLPRLTDSTGRCILPVHLGGTACRMMPFVIQFLAQWGPGEMRAPRSPVPARQKGGVRVLERLTAGCLVLARRRWIVSMGENLRRETAAMSEEEAFAALNRWRMKLDLPERLFWIEKMHYHSIEEVYKPQYLDFTSPLFVEVFRSALRINHDPLTFEEVLPGPGDLPSGPGGERRAVELHLDTLSLGPDDLPVDLAGRVGFSMASSSLASGERNF